MNIRRSQENLGFEVNIPKDELPLIPFVILFDQLKYSYPKIADMTKSYLIYQLYLVLLTLTLIEIGLMQSSSIKFNHFAIINQNL